MTDKLMLTDVPDEGDTVTIGDVTLTFVSSAKAPHEIQIGATVEESIKNSNRHPLMIVEIVGE